MTTLSHSNPASNPLAECLHFVRRSRSLASMLPALLLSSVMTLVVTMVMHLLWYGWATHGWAAQGLSEHFVRMWMESWLISWSIAFPVTYLAGPLLLKLAASVLAPRAPVAPRVAGIAFNDIAGASERVTAANGFTVLRNLKVKDDFRA
ncbi:MAG: DUF2798 domain-containing protein [Noviherbaspirillum sp.]